MKRRGPGRPQRDYSDDPDLEIAETAIVLKAAGFSERMAFDLALIRFQGERIIPSRVPRGTKRRPLGPVIGFRLPLQQSFSGRARDIRRKLKLGKLHSRPEVRTFALWLEARRKSQGR